jgi:hypothetical protein
MVLGGLALLVALALFHDAKFVTSQSGGSGNPRHCQAIRMYPGYNDLRAQRYT